MPPMSLRRVSGGGKLVTEPLKLERGDVDAGLAGRQAPGQGARSRIGGQEHFYLEAQIALRHPGRG